MLAFGIWYWSYNFLDVQVILDYWSSSDFAPEDRIKSWLLRVLQSILSLYVWGFASLIFFILGHLYCGGCMSPLNDPKYLSTRTTLLVINYGLVIFIPTLAIFLAIELIHVDGAISISVSGKFSAVVPATMIVIYLVGFPRWPCCNRKQDNKFNNLWFQEKFTLTITIKPFSSVSARNFHILDWLIYL